MRKSGFLILNLKIEQTYPLSRGHTRKPAFLPMGMSLTQQVAKKRAEGGPAAAEAERGAGSCPLTLRPLSPSSSPGGGVRGRGSQAHD